MSLKSSTSGILFLLAFAMAISTFAQGGASLTQIKTVVIDPGHGGKHPGAISKNGKYQEKHITLSIGLKLGEYIRQNHPDIKVIYTRTSDKYVDLDERADIANRNKADLFISIHVNATKSTSVSGTETFVMGTHKSGDNFEVCKAENSVIVMEDNYQAKYEGFNPDSPESYIIFSLLQNTHLEQSLSFASHIQQQFKKGPVYNNRGVKQGGLLVLWKTTMPAILTEVGFISNTKDYNVIITKEGQQELAKRLFDAFSAYKKEYEKGVKPIQAAEIPRPAPQEKQSGNNRDTHVNLPEKTAGSPATADDFFAVQILAINKLLKSNAPDFKGRSDYAYLKTDNLYKYYIGNYPTRQEAAKALISLRRNFPGAFVIRIQDNKIVK